MNVQNGICPINGLRCNSTFNIRVIYRDNTSWQGEIQWLEGKQTRYFRSLLEMIMLMNEAMKTTDQPQANFAFRNWDS